MFPYITPSYFYEEMDTFDLSKAISCMDPKAYAECFPEAMGRSRRKAVDEAISHGIIRKDKI